MSKASQFSTGIKVLYSLHWLLTILSVGGILYLVFSLRETQTELKKVKESACALCDTQTTVEIESNTIWPIFERIVKKEGRHESKNLNEKQSSERRIRRALFSKQDNNETCADLIRNFMKLLKVTNQLEVRVFLLEILRIPYRHIASSTTISPPISKSFLSMLARRTCSFLTEFK